MNHCGCGFVLTGTAKDQEDHQRRCVYALNAKLRAEVEEYREALVEAVECCGCPSAQRALDKKPKEGS